MKVKINLKYEDLKRFISVVSTFSSNVDMIKGRYVVDCKSIMGVLSLDFTKDTYVKIYSDDENEIERFVLEMKNCE